MGKLNDELLQRLKDATLNISSRTSNGSKATPTRSEHLDADIRAAQQLLVRQAQSLIDIHNGSEARTPELLIPGQDLLEKRLEDAASIAMSKFYCYRYDRVPDEWRHLYTDTAVLRVFSYLLRTNSDAETEDSDVWNRVADILDRALITTGGQSECLGKAWIEDTLDLMSSLLAEEAPNKRQKLRKLSSEPSTRVFSSAEPYGRPEIRPTRECPRHVG